MECRPSWIHGRNHLAYWLLTTSIGYRGSLMILSLLSLYGQGSELQDLIRSVIIPSSCSVPAVQTPLAIINATSTTWRSHLNGSPAFRMSLDPVTCEYMFMYDWTALRSIRFIQWTEFITGWVARTVFLFYSKRFPQHRKLPLLKFTLHTCDDTS